MSGMQILSRMAVAKTEDDANEIRHEKGRPKPSLARTLDFTGLP
jgi:hypothetical protein